MPFLIAGWIVGAVLFASALVYFGVDHARTGQLYRRKQPMMTVGAIGGLIAVGCVFAGIFLDS